LALNDSLFDRNLSLPACIESLFALIESLFFFIDSLLVLIDFLFERNVSPLLARIESLPALNVSPLLARTESLPALKARRSCWSAAGAFNPFSRITRIILTGLSLLTGAALSVCAVAFKHIAMANAVAIKAIFFIITKINIRQLKNYITFRCASVSIHKTARYGISLNEWDRGESF
jgi:hypothetical protein